MTTSTQVDLTGDYALDPAHSRIGFGARHLMVSKVRGEFAEFAGTVHLDNDPERSGAELTIQAGSIRTGLDMRDDALRGAEFLDAGAYPTLTFTSTQVEAKEGHRYRVTGDLTIRDVTRQVTVDFEHTGATDDPWGNFRIGFEGRAVINRKEWGVGVETGGAIVGEEVTLEFDMAAVRTA